MFLTSFSSARSPAMDGDRLPRIAGTLRPSLCEPITGHHRGPSPEPPLYREELERLQRPAGAAILGSGRREPRLDRGESAGNLYRPTGAQHLADPVQFLHESPNEPELNLENESAHHMMGEHHLVAGRRNPSPRQEQHSSRPRSGLTHVGRPVWSTTMWVLHTRPTILDGPLLVHHRRTDRRASRRDQLHHLRQGKA